MTYMHDKSLVVQLATDSDPNKWEPCFTLPNIQMPSVTYLGFSAETGELADSHDIISVETRNLYTETAHHSDSASAAGSTKPKKVKHQSGGSWTWTFVKFIMFGFIVAGAYIGFTAYRTQKSKSRF